MHLMVKTIKYQTNRKKRAGDKHARFFDETSVTKKHNFLILILGVVEHHLGRLKLDVVVSQQILVRLGIRGSHVARDVGIKLDLKN